MEQVRGHRTTHSVRVTRELPRARVSVPQRLPHQVCPPLAPPPRKAAVFEPPRSWPQQLRSRGSDDSDGATRSQVGSPNQSLLARSRPLSQVYDGGAAQRLLSPAAPRYAPVLHRRVGGRAEAGWRTRGRFQSPLPLLAEQQTQGRGDSGDRRHGRKVFAARALGCAGLHTGVWESREGASVWPLRQRRPTEPSAVARRACARKGFCWVAWAEISRHPRQRAPVGGARRPVRGLGAVQGSAVLAGRGQSHGQRRGAPAAGELAV
mmetsp:Transcript_36750/g.86922  ORF Transcript_36750/g.86922 Transcript_36750/m.86922 type:complete len:264 (+) Transcript_36750:636-1427(+)